MKNDEKEMDLEKLEAELISAKYDYRDICDVNFTPINKTNTNNISFGALIIILVWIAIGGLNLSHSSVYEWVGGLCFLLLFIISYNISPLMQKKFYLSDFSIRDLERIKSNQFLLTEFKNHLIDSGTAVSAEFSKIAKSYRKELKNKIDCLSNLKERLEREILIKLMQ